MKIANSAITLYAQHQAEERHQQRETLTVWRGGEQRRLEESNQGGRPGLARELRQALRDQVVLSHSAREVQRRSVQPSQVQAGEEEEMVGDLNMRLLQAMFERLTGRKFRVIDPLKLETPAETPAVAAPDQGRPQEPVGAGFGLIYEYQESYYESEKLQFSASGTIATSDGQTIDFSLALSMSREFYQEQNISIRAGEALKDPLVINFSGTAAQLSRRDFHFDIDADGRNDQIAFVTPGSGFLALDRNGDGAINDGSELFGALSGDGFADLRHYDGDGNGWIDNNDQVYDSLRVWTRDGEGRTQLMSLGMAGVGALYLGAIETAFSIKDADNALLGQLRRTGLAVLESGQVTTMQQIDLVA
jgi:hypothetical protein